MRGTTCHMYVYMYMYVCVHMLSVHIYMNVSSCAQCTGVQKYKVQINVVQVQLHVPGTGNLRVTSLQ